jgi:zinc D-Ala-D-Ala carboxypeptidase
MIDEKITRNFSLSEFCNSDTAVRLGIDNTPTAMVVGNLRNVLIPGMQSVRDILSAPIFVKSGYRCPDLNRAVRGASSSDHLMGNAADFVAPAFGTPLEICKRLVEHIQTLQFDQLIFEGGWVHISFSARRRNEVLSAHFTSNGVNYTPGLA